VFRRRSLSYSVDVLKKSAFQDELTNVLEIVPVEYRDQEWVTVEAYFKRRIKQLDEKTKS
jgi:uncharacterized circularly permuted ATP-grasp superfamily protein